MKPSKGSKAWDEMADDYDEYEDEYYEEDEEEDEDYAMAQKVKENKSAKAAAAAKQASAKKQAAVKPKVEPAPKKTAPAPVENKPLTNDEKAKIEEDNRRSNYKAAFDLLGGDGPVRYAPPTVKLPEGKTIETFVPSTDEDFDLLAEYIGGHLAVYSAEFQYPKMLKKLIEHATKHVTVGDLDQLSSAVSSLHSLRIQTIEAQRSQAAQSAPKNQSRHDDFPDFM